MTSSSLTREELSRLTLGNRVGHPEQPMRIKSLAPWFGGKRSMAPLIEQELGRHSMYWEPFCGSMAVLLRKRRAASEAVNDLHGDLVNLARVIQDSDLGSRFYRRLRRIWVSEEQTREAVEALRSWDGQPAPEPACLERALAYFLASWGGRNGHSGTSAGNAGFSVRFTKNGGDAAQRFNAAIESIPAWRRRMREVLILHQCGFGLLERIDDAEGTSIYLDPPYVEKGSAYLHDFQEDDHRRLAELARRFSRTRVVISYYDHPLLRDLYDGWTFVHAPRAKALVSQGMRNRSGASIAPEVLIINGPSLGQGPGLFDGLEETG